MSPLEALAQADLNEVRDLCVNKLLDIDAHETADAIDANAPGAEIIEAAIRDAQRTFRGDVRAAVTLGATVGVFCNKRSST